MSREALLIRRSKLEGQVQLQGAKNAALKLLAASLLTSDSVVIENYPAGLLDTQTHVEMLEKLGKKCTVESNRLTISELSCPPSELAWNGRSIRNTLLILGALFARTGAGQVPLPGGCDLGNRKYDLHMKVLEAFGGSVYSKNGFLCAERAGPLRSAIIELPIRSTGATENALIIASMAEGTSSIYNPHVRPEVINLADMLKLMGAKIEVHGQERIDVTGNPDGLGGARVTVIPDNMEALTWIVAAAMTAGQILIPHFPFDHLEVPLIFLRESGVRLFRDQENALVAESQCYPLEFSTGPYPGINSDMQPILAAFATQANGLSKIVDLRFPGRYQYAAEMEKMGVQARAEGDLLLIRGGEALSGADVIATDLRAGIALALLGLVADGETKILQPWQITRGYADFVSKLRALGGKVDEI